MWGSGVQVTATGSKDVSVDDRLARLDACALSDALDQLGHAGVLDGVVSLGGPVRISGRVVTVLLGRPSSEVSSRHLCTAAVEASGPGQILVVAHQGRTDCAGWGGNLSRAARQRGIAGTIVDGAVRDVDESRDIAYPVFARGATPRTARGRAHEQAWGEPVVVNGVEVATGDYVVADGTGVVFVPQALAEAAVAAAEAIVDKEAAMAAAIEKGVPVSSVMSASYETMLRQRT